MLKCTLLLQYTKSFFVAFYIKFFLFIYFRLEIFLGFSESKEEPQIPFLCVRDNGCGMTHEQALQMLSLGREQSKVVNESSIGKFGVGFKVQFFHVDEHNGLDTLMIPKHQRNDIDSLTLLLIIIRVDHSELAQIFWCYLKHMMRKGSCSLKALASFQNHSIRRTWSLISFVARIHV